MAGIICEAIVEDGATMKDVLKELSDIGVRSQVFRNYIYVDYQSDKLIELRYVESIFHNLKNSQIKQTG